MPVPQVKRALISVYDKTGIADFARALVNEFDIEIISTGGTADLLKKEGVPVTLVEDLTGFGSMLDGRVKTLHPAIHAAILADRDNPDHMRQLDDAGIKPIDMVVVNLYPFGDTISKPDCTFEQAIEMIDIGGPCMLRAAAKNHKHVLAVCNRKEFEAVLAYLRGAKNQDKNLRIDLAWKAFSETHAYDRLVWEYLLATADGDDTVPDPAKTTASVYAPILQRSQILRYGENPHQKGSAYRDLAVAHQSWTFADHFDSGASLNNYLDADAALNLCSDLSRAAPQNERSSSSSELRPSTHLHRYSCVLVKHNNPCGCGVADDPIEAYRRAYLGDPFAAMGGILACNFGIDRPFADAVMNSLSRWGKDAGAVAYFVEVWLAPSFDDDAVELIRASKQWGKRVRLVTIPTNLSYQTHAARYPAIDAMDIRSITGGVLLQTRDTKGIELDAWKVVTRRGPTDREWCDLKLAWLCAKHAKSNAISLARNGQLLASGAGQTSRVVSCELAIHLARRNGHLIEAGGDKGHCVAASDGFFPFRDGPDILIEAGVTAIIQPGGSKRDDDTIVACDERGVVCVTTGTRHFRH